MRKYSVVIGLVYICCAAFILLSRGAPVEPGTDAFDGGVPKVTIKNLNIVEPRNAIEALPYVIANPGSYYLVKNMTATSDITGITITCSDVVVDLNGFALIGAETSGDGIKVVGTNENISIKNGSIREWTGYGINAPGANDGEVEDIKANRNGLCGIHFGDGARISSCSVFGNGYKAALPPSYMSPTIIDSDQDGLDDTWEQQLITAYPTWFFTLADVNPWQDPDGDGSSNMDEFNAGTDPTLNELPDSDFDGMDDVWEQQIVDYSEIDSITGIMDVWDWEMPPGPYSINADFDQDGALNMDEFNSGTDPTDPSSRDLDWDGMNDGWELSWDWAGHGFTNIIDIWSVMGHMDYDNDGATTWDEYKADPPTDPSDPSSVPAVSGVQSDYASYTNPPTGPLYDMFDDPTDEPTDDGIRTGGYATVKDCKARGNRGTGIYCQYGSRIVNCVTAANFVDGILAADYCTVINCTAARNKMNGITMGSKNRVQDNNCGQNGDFEMNNAAMPQGAGLLILGNGNRVEDNNVSGNALGIEVSNMFSYEYGGAGMSGGRNLIIGNSCVDNWGKAFDLSGGDYMGGTMTSSDYGDAAATNNAAMMDANNPFSNFNF